MSARDDYPTLANHALGLLQFVSVSDAGALSAALDEIDRLRIETDRLRDMLAEAVAVLADYDADNNRLRATIADEHTRLWSDEIQTEIRAAADLIVAGASMCGATQQDTEARGWTWHCSLPAGHAGHHKCIGASW